MCALVPPPFPNFGWPSEEQIYDVGDHAGTFLDFPLPPPPPPPQALDSLDFSLSSETNRIVGNAVVIKKLNHNASERDRRKKINTLFSSLRSLLPTSAQSKKLSVPETVSSALKYIPGLREQVTKLMEKKEELLQRLSISQKDLMYGDVGGDQGADQPTKSVITSSVSTISATRLGETEAMVQISSSKAQKGSFSDVLSGLEDDGFLLMNASSFASRGERLFYTLHFQVDRDYKIGCEDLSDKLLSLYEKRRNSFRL